ncbi:MAG TPA: Maf family nucleotide pyrophosphatase [Gammaproteobacteria bacterium]|jgi:septum formation protein|nr:Maf family nucleotide pyrophosphatase [Gammaproteobacteria bacterium]
MPPIPLVLASTSPHRRLLLERLGLPFSCVAPGVDETRSVREPVTALVPRLSRAKAEAVAARHPGAIIIGSDQAAEREGEILGKPGDHSTATAQLKGSSGKYLKFHTGLCLLDTRDGRRHEHVDVTRVIFRSLTDTEIERYLQAEQPYECAGSFKSEGLGISLFEGIESDDPSALVGLPLIVLCRFLRECGVTLP